MATFHAEYHAPKHTAEAVTDDARAAFRNAEAEQLFAGLGLRGGFQDNAHRVFMMDETGKLVTPPPYDPEKGDDGMTAAARDGRLYVMDRNFSFRQVRLEQDANNAFAFLVTDSLNRQQRPMGFFEYHAKRLSTMVSEFTNNVKRSWAEADRRAEERRERIDKFFKRVNERIEKVMGPTGKIQKALDDAGKEMSDFFLFLIGFKKPPKKAATKAADGPLVPEDAPPEAQQTVSTPKEEQIQQPAQSELTTEQLLATKPTKLPNDQFLSYLDALDHRGQNAKVTDLLQNKTATPETYYETLAQGMEGQTARQIKAHADGLTDPETKAQFLKEQKPLMASISQGLRAFVQERSDPTVVNAYFETRAKGADTTELEKNLLQDSQKVQAVGVRGYLDAVNNSNAALRQAQQAQPQAQQTGPQLQQPQVQPPTAKPPMAGR